MLMKWIRPSDANVESLALREIERQQTMVTIEYNIPPSEVTGNCVYIEFSNWLLPKERTNILSVNKEITLMEFREKMQKVFLSFFQTLVYQCTKLLTNIKLVNLPLFDFKMFRVSFPSKLEITHDPKKQLGTNNLQNRSNISILLSPLFLIQ